MSNSSRPAATSERSDTYPSDERSYPIAAAPGRDVSKLHALVACSPAMVELRATVGRVGPSRATVLVAGEPGSGKGLVARAIHEASPRARGRFVMLDCSAIPTDALEELLFGAPAFGPPRGASLCGAIQAANGGTLFLREIGMLPLFLQPRLLRFLDDGEPLGSRSRGATPDVRLLASTSETLPLGTASGRFRRDLGERLELVVLRVPPLRERLEDLPGLILAILREEAGTSAPPALSDSALAALSGPNLPPSARALRERLLIALARAGGASELALSHVALR